MQGASVALGDREAAGPPPPPGMDRGVVALPSRHAAADLHFVWEVAAGAGKDAATTLHLPACGKSCGPSRAGSCGNLLSTLSLVALLHAQQCWAPTRAHCLFCAAFPCFGCEGLEERMEGAGMGGGAILQQRWGAEPLIHVLTFAPCKFNLHGNSQGAASSALKLCPPLGWAGGEETWGRVSVMGLNFI